MNLFFKLSFFVTFLLQNNLLVNCDEVLVQINVNRPINTVSNKYVSFSIDPKIISENVGGNNSQIIDYMASQLSPAYLKISGETFFKLTSILSNNIEFEDESSKDTRPQDLLKNFNDWISSVGWKPIIPLSYTPHQWDSMEALRVLNISSALGITDCVWQLGIDFNATAATSYVADLITLQTMVGAFHDYVDDWRIIGADISAGSSAEETKLYVDLVKNIVEAVGWMPSSSGFLNSDPSLLYTDLALKSVLNNKLPAWLSLPLKTEKYPTADSGCSVFCVTEGLQWAQVLGEAARTGFKVVYKPLDVNDFNEPTLNYYISLLFKRNMGEKVFDAKIIGGDKFVSRVYSHCAKERPGGLALMAINMGDERSKVLVKYSAKSTGSELWQYIITVNGGNIHVNDEVVHLNSTLNPFIKIKHPSRPISISLPPMSIGFWILPHANYDECIIRNDGKKNSGQDGSSEEQQRRLKPRQTRTSSDKLLQQLIMKNAAAAKFPKLIPPPAINIKAIPKPTKLPTTTSKQPTMTTTTAAPASTTTLGTTKTAEATTTKAGATTTAGATKVAAEETTVSPTKAVDTTTIKDPSVSTRRRRRHIVKKDSNYLKQQLTNTIQDANDISMKFSDTLVKDALRLRRFVLKNDKLKGLESLIASQKSQKPIPLFDVNAMINEKKSKLNLIGKSDLLKPQGKRTKRQIGMGNNMPMGGPPGLRRRLGFRGGPGGGKFPLRKKQMERAIAATATLAAANSKRQKMLQQQDEQQLQQENELKLPITSQNIDSPANLPEKIPEDKVFEKKENSNAQNLPNGDVHFKLKNGEGDYDYIEFEDNQNHDVDSKKTNNQDTPDDESFGKIPSAFHETYQIQDVIPRDKAHNNGELWEVISKPDIQTISNSEMKHLPNDQHIGYITRELEPTQNQNNANLHQAQQQLQSYYMNDANLQDFTSTLGGSQRENIPFMISNFTARFIDRIGPFIELLELPPISTVEEQSNMGIIQSCESNQSLHNKNGESKKSKTIEKQTTDSQSSLTSRSLYSEKGINDGNFYPKPQLRNPKMRMWARLFEQQQKMYEMKLEKFELDYKVLMDEYNELKRRLKNANNIRFCSGDNTTQTSGIGDCRIDLADENGLREEGKFNCENIKMKRKIEELKQQNDKLSKENHEKTNLIQKLKNDIDELHLKMKEDNNKMREEFTNNSALICEKYENEKKSLNSSWEKKLNEIIESFKTDISNLTQNFGEEKSTFEDRLNRANLEIVELKKQNEELNTTINDLRTKSTNSADTTDSSQGQQAFVEKTLLEESLLKALVEIDNLTRHNNELNDCLTQINESYEEHRLKITKEIKKPLTLSEKRNQALLRKIEDLQTQVILQAQMLEKQNNMIQTLNSSYSIAVDKNIPVLDMKNGIIRKRCQITEQG